MDLPKWVSRIQALWVAIGTFIALLATQGVNLPDWASSLFSEATWNAFVGALGAVLAFYQVIRAIFANREASGAVPQNAKLTSLVSYLNPFKTSIYDKAA